MMSATSCSFLSEQSLLNSDISLVSHSDSSHSNNSPNFSNDSLNEPDRRRRKMVDNIEGIADLQTELDKIALDKALKEKGYETTNGEHNIQKKEDENANQHVSKLNEVEKPEKLIPAVLKGPTSPQKSKIPKSKTFESSLPVYNSKNGKPKTVKNGNDAIARNHVFMTSQECMVIPGSSKIPRETIASKLRLEKHATPHGSMSFMVEEADGYRTPTQRKDILLRDMKRQVREAKQICEEKDREIAMYKQHVDEKTSKLVQAKDDEIENLREELRKTKQSYDDISAFCEESISTASQLEQKAHKLKVAMDDREKEHQKIYLEMYRKGQNSARFEREEELFVMSEQMKSKLERLASAGGCKVTISELVKKLAWTELELAKWQTIRRDESYHDAPQPEGDSYTTLRFLKDAFFHYITDEKDSDHHLRAMIKIFRFTEPQMEKIRQSKLIEWYERRHKNKMKKAKQKQYQYPDGMMLASQR